MCCENYLINQPSKLKILNVTRFELLWQDQNPRLVTPVTAANGLTLHGITRRNQPRGMSSKSPTRKVIGFDGNGTLSTGIQQHGNAPDTLFIHNIEQDV